MFPLSQLVRLLPPSCRVLPGLRNTLAKCGRDPSRCVAPMCLIWQNRPIRVVSVHPTCDYAAAQEGFFCSPKARVEQYVGKHALTLRIHGKEVADFEILSVSAGRDRQRALPRSFCVESPGSRQGRASPRSRSDLITSDSGRHARSTRDRPAEDSSIGGDRPRPSARLGVVPQGWPAASFRRRGNAPAF